MKFTDVLASFYQMNLGILKMTIADFSEAEMFTRPCPGANHAMWQLGHLICAEASMVNGVTPGAVQAIPAGFEEKFSKDRATLDDPKEFPTKDELLAVVESVRCASVSWVKTLEEHDLVKPGPEKMRNFIPTIGIMVNLIPDHLAMHVGQLQVIRRKLGKPHVM